MANYELVDWLVYRGGIESKGCYAETVRAVGNKSSGWNAGVKQKKMYGTTTPNMPMFSTFLKVL